MNFLTNEEITILKEFLNDYKQSKLPKQCYSCNGKGRRWFNASERASPGEDDCRVCDGKGTIFSR